VTAGSGCAWTATSNAGWVRVTEGQSGSGNGTVQLTVDANSGAPRTATVTIAGQTFTLRQDGPDCRNTINPTSTNVGPAATQTTVAVNAGAGCTWVATSQAAWISVAEGEFGTGTGTVRLQIQANTTQSARTGTVTIAGETLTVRQDAAPAPQPACTYSIKPTEYDSGRGPDTINIRVTTAAGCAWTATSPVPWVTVSQGSSGSGDGNVRLSVQANSGPRRTATLTIAGQTFTLRQEGTNAP
jgi:hypothetical protein